MSDFHHAIFLPTRHQDVHHLFSLRQWHGGDKNYASAQHCKKHSWALLIENLVREKR